jgi:hypothetical protein
MALSDALFLEPSSFNIWIAARTDRVLGSGTAADPYNGAAQEGPPISITLTNVSREAIADTGAIAHHFVDGDVVTITGVTGEAAETWNGTFGVYGVTDYSFKYYMRKPPAAVPEGGPTVRGLTILFDRLLREMPANSRIQLGPGVYLTRGFAPNDSRGWQPKTGQKIVGAGTEVTILQLVGAENTDQHYHVIGMPIEPRGSTPIVPLTQFEVSDLTLDANLDNQPGRPTPGYAPVACGAVRIFGHHSRVSRVKAINWGTKSLKRGCFVISIIQASGQPTVDGNPVITAKDHCGIEDCIAIDPSRFSARESTVLHIGGLRNLENHALGFGRGPFIRRNFVDCQFRNSQGTVHSSAFITSKSSTTIDPVTNVGTFIGKRPHFRVPVLDEGTFARFYNPKDPKSRWNGYYRITPVLNTTDQLGVTLGPPPSGTTNDSSLVMMGFEIRALAMNSCEGGVVEENQIHHCWIGGPHQSILDDDLEADIEYPTAPSGLDLATEQRLDRYNAPPSRQSIVRNNVYKDVGVGPYFNMGGFSGAVEDNEITYDALTGLVTVETTMAHKLWVGARVKIEAAPDPRYEGLQEITEVTEDTQTSTFTFSYKLSPGLLNLPGGTASYRVVSGVDDLLIEGNVIELMDLDETEFAIKEYTPGTPTFQSWRTCGIIVGDNGLSQRAGPHVHGLVLVWNNKIYYVDGRLVALREDSGLGRPAGRALQIAGAKHAQVQYNIIELNARNAQQTFRCGPSRFFSNKHPNGKILPGWCSDVNGHYDEPETLAEDAFVLSRLKKRR